MRVNVNLKRRLAKLETSAATRQARIEPDYSEEDLACMQRIIDRIYADPDRYANRIALFERIMVEQAAAERVAQG